MKGITERKYSRKVVVFAFLATILLTSYLTFRVAETVFSGTVDTVPVYLEPFSPYTYLIECNSTHYFGKNGTTGELTISDNASYIFEYITTFGGNQTVYVGIGDFYIDYMIPVQYSYTRFIGSGYGSRLVIGANGGFNLSSTSNLFGCGFENLYWMGDGVAIHAIISVMPVNVRVSDLMIRKNRFISFTGTGAITLDLQNIENSHFEDNTFYQTGRAHIRFTSNGYDSGNIRMTGNEYYNGYGVDDTCSVIFESTSDVDGNGGVSNIYAWGNHYLFVTNGGYAVNITSTAGSPAGYHFTSERLENGGFIYANSTNSSAPILNIQVVNCRILNPEISNQFLFDYGIYVRRCKVTESYLHNSGSGGYIYRDNSTSSSQWNSFTHNDIGSGTFDGGLFTYVHGNSKNMETYYTVKTEGTDNLRGSSDAYISNFGTTVKQLSSGQQYSVQSGDVYLTVSGGTVTSIEIYDYDGTLIASLGSSCEGYRVAWRQLFEITWSSEPTMKFLWVQ